MTNSWHVRLFPKWLITARWRNLNVGGGRSPALQKPLSAAAANAISFMSFSMAVAESKRRLIARLCSSKSCTRYTSYQNTFFVIARLTHSLGPLYTRQSFVDVNGLRSWNEPKLHATPARWINKPIVSFSVRMRFWYKETRVSQEKHNTDGRLLTSPGSK